MKNTRRLFFFQFFLLTVTFYCRMYKNKQTFLYISKKILAWFYSHFNNLLAWFFTRTYRKFDKCSLFPRFFVFFSRFALSRALFFLALFSSHARKKRICEEKKNLCPPQSPAHPLPNPKRCSLTKIQENKLLIQDAVKHSYISTFPTQSAVKHSYVNQFRAQDAAQHLYHYLTNFALIIWSVNRLMRT